MASDLTRSTIDSSVLRLSQLQDKRTILEDLNRTTYRKEDIDPFIENVQAWYPVYEKFGQDVYLKSSIFWRILTYIPLINRISGFVSYEKLGKNAALMDIDKLKTFLREDVPQKIKDLEVQIRKTQIANDEKRSSLD